MISCQGMRRVRSGETGAGLRLSFNLFLTLVVKVLICLGKSLCFCYPRGSSCDVHVCIDISFVSCLTGNPAKRIACLVARCCLVLKRAEGGVFGCGFLLLRYIL